LARGEGKGECLRPSGEGTGLWSAGKEGLGKGKQRPLANY